MQIDEVGIKFNGSKIYSFDPNGLELNVGDHVVVDTANGPDVGKVSRDIRQVEGDMYDEPMKKVLRIASDADIKKAEEVKNKVRGYKARIIEIIKKHGLDMKVISVDASMDMSKITVSFTSENRVDFRELVKELASEFKSRIELKQIGARDEVKIVGGMGPCGRECCCTRALDSFCHVTIKMAKNQGLSLNPASISGSCGRLMCCLAYENEHYVETLKVMPKFNMEVETPDGKGLVIYNDLLRRESTVKIKHKDDSFEIKSYKLSDMKFNRGKED